MIKWIRIDDRLIHGQVASSWLSHTQVEQVIVVSDKVAGDDIQKSVLKMAAPGVKVHVFTIEHFVEVYKKQPIKRPTMLILPETLTALALVKKGVDISYINFGGMRAKGTPHAFYYDLSFSDEELDALYELIGSGVKVEYQMAAYDTPQDVLAVIEKYKKEGNN